MKEEKFLPVSTMVFDVQLGWGKVVGHSESTNYPLKIKFDDGDIELYAFDGKVSLDDKVPVLSLTEYSLESGGFTPISEYWIVPKVEDWSGFNLGNLKRKITEIKNILDGFEEKVIVSKPPPPPKDRLIKEGEEPPKPQNYKY